MEQLNLFEDQSEEMIMPKNIISPLETTKGVKTKEFKKVQRVWCEYVTAVQNYYNCSWFEAAELLKKHRDSQEPIKLMTGE